MTKATKATTATKPITMRLPVDLLQAIVKRSHLESLERNQNIGYTDLIRDALESSFADQHQEFVGKEVK